jgi:putative ubiquitin-RnfH superfamily antitoxin RatB of RatAB toxin-antitoxin module
MIMVPKGDGSRVENATPLLYDPHADKRREIRNDEVGLGAAPVQAGA